MYIEENTGQFLEDVYNYLIKDTLLPGENPNITNRLNDISMLEKSRGKLRFKKRNKEVQPIQIGDTVANNGVKAEVIDIDGELLCCRVCRTDEVTIWYADEVKKL